MNAASASSAINIWIVSLAAVLYLALLFLIAYWADRTSSRDGSVGQRVINSPIVYTLSIAVYCTSWTFFGAVGTAARSGLEFMAIYLGPSVLFFAWAFYIRKLARVSRTLRITSIADFISSRFGKSQGIAALVTIVAVIATTPYISLQLKAVARSFDVLIGRGPQSLQSVNSVNSVNSVANPPDLAIEAIASPASLWIPDTALMVAFGIGVFTLLFGTRHLNANERHSGIVAAIAFESLVKLFAFVCIGVFVVWGINGSPEALVRGMLSTPDLQHVFSLQEQQYNRWMTLLIVSAIAAICLPRQFQVTVIENENGDHLRSAAWMFPLYLLVLSMFVVPIAWTGLATMPAQANPDLFVLTLPLSQGNQWLALLAFIGGFSSATSMMIIASVVLALMICNHIVVPLLVRFDALDPARSSADFSRALLSIRRGGIILVLALGYLYLLLSEDTAALASIGLISFAGVAQLLPAIALGIFWRRATSRAAFWSITAGALIWIYTLLLPAIERSGVPLGLLADQGPLGLSWLHPEQLAWLTGWDPLTHSLFISLTVNFLIMLLVSSFGTQRPLDADQATLFVDAFKQNSGNKTPVRARVASLSELKELSQRFLGTSKTNEIFADAPTPLPAHPTTQQTILKMPIAKSEQLIRTVESALAGSMGAASARVIVNRLSKSQSISPDEAIQILDEAQQLAAYSRQLELQRRELTETANKLVRANARLTTIDRNKDEFLRQISHELRTPLTSVRSFVSILEDNSATLEPQQRTRFLEIIRRETERLTRMLEGMLIQRRVEEGADEANFVPVNPIDVLNTAIDLVEGAALANDVDIEVCAAPTSSHLSAQDSTAFSTQEAAEIWGDPDAINQVFLNILTNAIKFADPKTPQISITYGADAKRWTLTVQDNGPGFADLNPFDQSKPNKAGRWIGAGIGLRVSRDIVIKLGGDISVSNQNGAQVSVEFPLLKPSPTTDSTDDIPAKDDQ